MGNRKIALLLVVLLFLMVAVFPARLILAKTTASPITSACAVTPELMAGQGGYAAFALGGYAPISLGYNLFSLGGYAAFSLGYLTTGLGGYALSPAGGYAFSALGDMTQQEIEALIAEINNNLISKTWIQGLMPEISFGDDFNSVQTAVVIIDDFEDGEVNEHGELVGQVFADLEVAVENWLVNNTGFSEVAIDFYGLDISVGGGYQLDLIEPAIENTVLGLYNTGYRHFVLNMSFGLLPCEDPEFNFSFSQFLAAREQALGPQPIQPELECVADHGNGNYTAYFGYDNQNYGVVEIPVDGANLLSPDPLGGYPVTTFQTGRNYDVFRVDFNGEALSWSVTGPDGIARHAYASAGSPKTCTPYQDVTTGTVIPHMDCIVENPNGGYTAYFGYQNTTGVAVRAPMGEANRFTPAPRKDYGQDRVFASADGLIVPNAFEVNFPGGTATWTLEGPDGVRRTASANSADPAQFCPPFPTIKPAFGIIQYLTENGYDAGTALASMFGKLADQPEPLADMRALLATYLTESANPDSAFRLFALASSGNYATLLGTPETGAPPLYPAAFPETIAVGATMADGITRWSGSHHANVMAPGAWYVFGSSFVGAGTSYSAPHASMIAALYLTYGDACEFTPANPALKPEAASGFNNVPFVANSSMPLACYPNNAPTPVPDIGTTPNGDLLTTATGLPITIDVLANDTDPNGDTLTVSAVQSPTNAGGTATVNADNTVTYVSNAAFPDQPGGVATDTFLYQVSDGQFTEEANVSVDVIRLDLVPQCPIGDFTVLNNGSIPVDYSWTIAGTGVGGTGTAQANSSHAISTGASEDASVVITVNGIVHDSETALNAGTCLPTVARFMVVDPLTDTDIGEIAEGSVVDLSSVPGHKINIRADVATALVGGAQANSVVFDLDNTPRYRVDNTVPYSLAGDVNGDYDFWRLQPNRIYNLTATPYSGADGTGAAGRSATINFWVVESASLSKLLLESQCQLGVFNVVNPNNVPLEYTWVVDSTGATGSGVVDPNSTLAANTGATSGTVYLYVADVEQDHEVVDGNCAPQFSATPTDQINSKRSMVSLQLYASDPNEGDVLTFSATGLPEGLSIAPATGLISGTIQQKAGGTYYVTATVQDQYGARDVITFLWTVQ